jgi:hypothetical protein
MGMTESHFAAIFNAVPIKKDAEDPIKSVLPKGFHAAHKGICKGKELSNVYHLWYRYKINRLCKHK